MRRFHLTLVLALLAAVGAVLAVRLTAPTASEPVTAEPPAAEVHTVPVAPRATTIPELSEPVVVELPPDPPAPPRDPCPACGMG